MFAKLSLYHQVNSFFDGLTMPFLKCSIEQTSFFLLRSVGNLDKFILRYNRRLSTARDIKLLGINNRYNEVMRTAEILFHSERKNILSLTISLIPRKGFQDLFSVL